YPRRPARHVARNGGRGRREADEDPLRVVSAPALGRVGSILFQAERDKLPADHPLRRVDERMDSALQAWGRNPYDPVILAQLNGTWGSTKLAWQQYLENRYDPEKPFRRASLSQVSQ